MSPKEHALELLAIGVPPVQVAATIGCDESYISQLMGNEDFVLELASKKAAATQEDIKFDNLLANAEQQALENIEKRLPLANMQQSLQAFRILNTARRRKDGNILPTDGGTTVVVNISLPQVAIPHFITNEKAEIVEVGGQTMISASPKQVEALSNLKRDQQLRIEAATVKNPVRDKKADELLDVMSTTKPGRRARTIDLADLI
jgi:hypothetical protein